MKDILICKFENKLANIHFCKSWPFVLSHYDYEPIILLPFGHSMLASSNLMIYLLKSVSPLINKWHKHFVTIVHHKASYIILVEPI